MMDILCVLIQAGGGVSYVMMVTTRTTRAICRDTGGDGGTWYGYRTPYYYCIVGG